MAIHDFETNIFEVFEQLIEWFLLVFNFLIPVVESRCDFKSHCAFEVKVY